DCRMIGKKKLYVTIVAHDADRDYLIRSNNTYIDNSLLSGSRELKRNQQFKNYFAGLGFENQLRNQGLFKINSEIFKGNSDNFRFLSSNYNSENINIELEDIQETSGVNLQFDLLQKLNSRYTLNSKLFFVHKKDNQ